jgi:RNA polymerase sigma-70 factor (ECF subfamily)
MAQDDGLAERFEAHRAHLRAVAYRMLGSLSEADDAVQEAWLRLSRSDSSGVDNLGGWLTTIVARVCLNMLQSRRSRREELVGEYLPEPIASCEDGGDPEHEALLADSVGLALIVVLDALTPAERLAFVLHDMFAVPFEEIAPIVGRSPAAARQLASRARRRVQGAHLLTPTCPAGGRSSAPSSPLPGAVTSRRFSRCWTRRSSSEPTRPRCGWAQPGRFGAARRWLTTSPDVPGQHSPPSSTESLEPYGPRGGRPRVVFRFTIRDGKIAAIDLLADQERLRQLDLAILDA